MSEHFVPRRVGQIVGGLLDHEWRGPAVPADRFDAFSTLVAALFHYEMHAREQTLSDAWYDQGGDEHLIDDHLDALLRDANYTDVSMAELDAALEEESLIPLRFEIDLDDYADLTVARRGTRTETVTIPKWKGLRSEQRTMTVDEDVVLHALVKPRDWFDARGIDPGGRNLRPGHRSLKQFQNVPRADIEMLLPSVQVRFRPIDAVLVGVPAVVSGIVVLATKLAPTIGLMILLVGAWLGVREDTPQIDQTALVVLFGGVVTLGGFLFRQWTKLKNRRVEHLKTLSENLYFRTVGDGTGVIHALLASAEEQEVIEVVLGYRFLLDSPDGLTPDELDRRTEAWLSSDGLETDFEVDDAIAKLDDLGLLEERGEGRLGVIGVDDALRTLDRRWDDLFQHR